MFKAVPEPTAAPCAALRSRGAVAVWLDWEREAESMSILRKVVKMVGGMAAILLLAAFAIALLPPWWGKTIYMLHGYTYIPYLYHFRLGLPPRNFSGVWREYGKGRTCDELSYKQGLRDGPQRYYDETGHLVRSCEFKDGRPWSGLCDFWEYKPWLAEYRDGKVWTGAMQEGDSKSPTGYSMKYYFQGKLYGEAEFRHLMGFETKGALIGVMCVR